MKHCVLDSESHCMHMVQIYSGRHTKTHRHKKKLFKKLHLYSYDYIIFSCILMIILLPWNNEYLENIKITNHIQKDLIYYNVLIVHLIILFWEYKYVWTSASNIIHVLNSIIAISVFIPIQKNVIIYIVIYYMQVISMLPFSYEEHVYL